MKVIIDSHDALEQALRVVGALYNVTVVVSGGSAEAPESRARKRASTSGAPHRVRPVSGGRKPRSSGRARAARRGAATTVSNAELRDWARTQGYTIADRGRLPREVVAAYQAAQQG